MSETTMQEAIDAMGVGTDALNQARATYEGKTQEITQHQLNETAKVDATIASIGLNVGAVDQDPNLVTDHQIFTNHSNCPIAGYAWHITTTFHAGIADDANRSQIAFQHGGTSLVFSRVCTNNVWSDWRNQLYDDIPLDYYETANGGDNRIVGESFSGDTAFDLKDVRIYRYVLGDLAVYSLRIVVGSFSKSIGNDDQFQLYFDIGGIMSDLGWKKPNFAHRAFGSSRVEFSASSNDTPILSINSEVTKFDSPTYPNMVLFKYRDSGQVNDMQIVTQAAIVANFTCKMKD